MPAGRRQRSKRNRTNDQKRREYEACVNTIDFIAILQANAHALLKRSGEA
jgi:hypothetical protein